MSGVDPAISWLRDYSLMTPQLILPAVTSGLSTCLLTAGLECLTGNSPQGCSQQNPSSSPALKCSLPGHSSCVPVPVPLLTQLLAPNHRTWYWLLFLSRSTCNPPANPLGFQSTSWTVHFYPRSWRPLEAKAVASIWLPYFHAYPHFISSS